MKTKNCVSVWNTAESLCHEEDNIISKTTALHVYHASTHKQIGIETKLP
jgi:hypothetical protein